MSDSPNPTDYFTMGAVVTAILLTFPLVIATDCIATSQEQDKAIEADAAHYHPQTGELVYGCEEDDDESQ